MGFLELKISNVVQRVYPVTTQLFFHANERDVLNERGVLANERGVLNLFI